MRPLLYSIFGFRKPKPASPKALTLRTALDRYVDEVSPLKKGGSRSDQSLSRTWLLTEYADWLLADISGPQVAAQRDVWLESFKPATVVRRLAILSHLYTTASLEWGHQELKNPVKMIRKPKVRNSRERRLFKGVGIPGFPASELEWIIHVTKSKYARPVFIFAVETAMRRGEIAGLLWENINFDACTAFLPDTKNGQDRTVPLSPLALQTLHDLHYEGATGRVFACSPSGFSRLFGRAVIRARALYERVCEESGIRPDPRFFSNLRFHDLRHEAISIMAPHFHAHELAKISGHRDTRMLMRYYHPDPSDLAARLAAI